MDKTLADIAAKTMNLATLATRNSDDQDFHSLAVWQIKEALVLAYLAGRAKSAPGARQRAAREARRLAASEERKAAALDAAARSADLPRMSR
jgi:hypothetical protein